MKLKKLGSVEMFDLKELTGNDAYEGARVGLKYVGAGKARDWTYRMQGASNRELERVLELRRGRPQSEAPELYEKDDNGMTKHKSEDYLREILRMSIDVVRECIASVEGLDGFESEKDPKKLAELIADLGLSEVLLRPALEMQWLKRSESFLSESSES